MRIYADLPEALVQKIDEYRKNKAYKMSRNQAFIEVINKFFKDVRK